MLHSKSLFLLLLFACPQNLFATEKPNVLILGDSISMGYTPIVTGLLADEANVVRPLNQNGGNLNCEGTTRGVQLIDQWLREGLLGCDPLQFRTARSQTRTARQRTQ